MDNEQLTQPQPMHMISPEAVQDVMNRRQDLFDTEVIIKRPGSETGLEAWRIEDVLNRREYDEAGNKTHTPVAVLEQADGKRLVVPIADMLAWQQDAQQDLESQEPDIHAADTIPRSQLNALLAKAEIRRVEDPYQGLIYEPAFKEITVPFRSEINRLNAEYRAAKAAAERTDEQRQREADPLYWDKLRQIDEHYEGEIQKQRDLLEAAVKPAIAECIKLFVGDKLPAYAYYGEVEVGRDAIVTKRGKTVARRQSYGFENDSIGPRLGQVTVNKRLKDWAGSSSMTKQNLKTKQHTTSREHIINLAAAMVAGNMGEENHPITYVRDQDAEHELPQELFGKLKLYRIDSGVHRVAAIRLLEGADALIPGREERK